jgi:uncharacterized protein YqcC (DUF446 family)
MIKVYYPHGGKHFLLHWSSYDERGNVILARTEKGVQQVADQLFQEHWDAEIQGYWEIDIVAPSDKMQQEAKEADHQSAVYYLHFEIIDRMRDLVEAGKTLPSPFSVCTSYELEEEDDERDEWGAARHYGCKNCHSTIKSSLSKEELHAKYNRAWRKQFPNEPYIDPKLVVSRAKPVLDGKKLFYADPSSFGDHGQGVVLQEFDPENPCYKDNLFWFHQVRELDHSSFSAVLTQKQQDQKEEREKVWAENKAANNKEEQEKIKKVLAIFQEGEEEQ